MTHVLASILLLFSSQETGFLSETKESFILKNNHLELRLSKRTGQIDALYYDSKPILQRGNCPELKQDGSVKRYEVSSLKTEDNFPISAAVEFTAEDANNSLVSHIKIDTLSIEWQISVFSKSCDAQEVCIDYVLAVTRNLNHLFYPGKDYAEHERNSAPQLLTYRRHFFVPLMTFFNKEEDYGVSIFAHFDVQKPDLRFILESDRVTFSFRSLQLTTENGNRVAISLVPHRGDWRPGLKYLLEKYPEYFIPAVNKSGFADGWYFQGRPYNTTETIDNAAARSTAWVEFHYYFPFYGLYAPQTKDWGLIADSDEIALSDWESGAGKSRNSYAQTNHLIDLWQKYGIKVYLYFQVFEAWHQYAKKYFGTDIALNAFDNPYPAFKLTNLLNPDPKTAWGKYILNQVNRLLEKYPTIDGIFYDRMDYWNYDFAHDDGTTMIDGKPTYMLGFALERINNQIFDLLHTQGKSVWGNGPTSIEVCRNLDGIMAETNPATLEKIKYLSIARPIIFLPYDRAPEQTESKLKYSLLSGAMPSQSYGDARCQAIDEKYRHLFDLLAGREWVLTPRPVNMPGDSRYNIFRTPAGDYVIVIVNVNKSQLIPHPFEYDIPIKLFIPQSNDIYFAYLMSGDWAGINKIDMNRDNGVIDFKIPFHRTSSLIYLTKSSKYDLIRVSSPILIRGNENTFEFIISKNAANNAHALRIHSSWFDRTVPLKSSRITMKEYVPEYLTGEVEIKLQYNGAEYEYSSWVVDPFSIEPKDEIFLNNPSGEDITFFVTNNMNRSLILNLKSVLTKEAALVDWPINIPLKAFESTQVDFFIQSASDNQISVIAYADNKKFQRTFAVKTALFPNKDDLYHDSHMSDIGGWIQHQGKWTVHKGVITGSGEAHLAYLQNPLWTDYVMEVQTRCRGSKDPFVDWLKSYLFFRVKDEKNFYRFGIHGDAGEIDLYKCINGRWIKIQSYMFTPEKERWYALRISVHGSTISGYVDGKRIINAEDNTLEHGGIGIGVLEDDMICDYRNIVVKKL